MKKLNRILFSGVAVLSLGMGCSKTSSNGSNSLQGGVNGTVPTITGNNVMKVEVGVGGSGYCNADSYENEPCTSVTICTTTTPSQCQTINNILVDTGSYGLRIFSSAIGISLTQIGTYAECAYFGTGSTWGPVVQANVVLGQESAVTVPMQVINNNFPSTGVGASYCSTTVMGVSSPPDDTPSNAGYNGILGVGLVARDCGAECVTNAKNQNYFTCSGSTCTGSTIALTNQVMNPVAAETTDNNGVMMVMPTVSTAGAAYNYGYLVLGVNTETNNKPSGTQTYTADDNANDSNYLNFTTSYNGSTVGGFIDSGSNGLFFPATGGSNPVCSDPRYSDWYCPNPVFSSSAINTGLNGVTSSTSFFVANAVSLFNTGNYLMNLGGEFDDGFDWGLPFFFGRYVYVGIEGKSATGVGTGPYWAY